MRHFILLILLGSALSSIHAQSLERWVIGAGGGYSTGSGIQLSDNIGETAVLTFDGNGDIFILNQGFEQGSTEPAPPAGVAQVPFNQNNLSVYPNPGNGLYFVQINVPGKENAAIIVNNVLGQRIQFATVSLNSDKVICQLDLRDYPAGVYFVQLHTGNTKLVKKLVHEGR